jgi:hypothetical protein
MINGSYRHINGSRSPDARAEQSIGVITTATKLSRVADPNALAVTEGCLISNKSEYRDVLDFEEVVIPGYSTNNFAFL